MNDVNSLSHTRWNCKYHIVFAPKYRRKVFYGQKRKEIVEIPPKYSVSSFMGYLKGKSSLMIYEKYPELKYKYRNREFWCRGYYVDAVDLGSNFIGEVCRQTLYRFQNGTMQFFFRDGRRAAAEFRSVLDAVHAPPDDLFSAVDIPSRPLVRAAAVTAEQSLGQGILAVVMSIKKRHFLPPQHLTSSFPAATVAFFIFIVSTLQQSSRPGTAGFPAQELIFLTPRTRKAPAFSGRGLMVAEQNVICSLPGYKYQIAPLARGYTCAVADCTFILAKRVFFCSIGYSLLWNHSSSEWFSFYKTVAPGPSGRQRSGIKIAPGTTSRALSGSVRIQDFMWRTQPGAGCLGDISLPLTGRAIHSLGQYRIILSADTASEVRQMLSQKRR